MVESLTIRRWATWLIVALALISLGVWLVRRDRLPWTIRIASGEKSGVYYAIGGSLRNSLERRLHQRPELLATEGSVQNFQMLKERRADLAIIQGGAAPLEQLAIVTPLYPEWMLIIARKESGVESAMDLIGKRVAIGKPGSGMRASAMKLLDRMQIAPEEYEGVEVYFAEMLSDSTIDAAIVTTGILNQDVRDLFATERFQLAPIEDAEALALTDPYFESVQIPRGALCERPAAPDRATHSLATISYLAARTDASDRLVDAALKAIHEENLRLKAPTLISRRDAPQRTTTRFHPVAQRYFQPEDELGLMANVMESLAAGKELLFALGAGFYLLWRRWALLRERELQEALSRQKEHLDLFMEQTLVIEAAQAKSDDIDKLYGYLNEVTELKLKVLHEFTEEELRGDQVFRIFLTQCANLISKIQLKILALRAS